MAIRANGCHLVASTTHLTTIHECHGRAEVVELADALRSGRSEGNLVGVRIPPSAPFVVRWVRVSPSVERSIRRRACFIWGVPSVRRGANRGEKWSGGFGDDFRLYVLDGFRDNTLSFTFVDPEWSQMRSPFYKPRLSLPLIAVAAMLCCVGCSMSKFAVGAMVPILDNSKTAALASSDIRTFSSATPSNLFLLEGLAETDPKNRDIREATSMLYFSYAFTFDAPEDEDYTSLLYLRGLEHGKAVLFQNRDFKEVWDKPFDEFAAGTRELRDKDLPALVWTVANWSQFIGLHLDSTEVLVDIPRVQVLLERAIELDGSYFEGLPYMIMGSLLAFRPPMLGGDPEGSKANFDKAIAVSEGKFLLAYYFYARFYCYRIQDADMFESTLMSVIEKPDDILPEYRLLNAIAAQKSANLLGKTDELF